MRIPFESLRDLTKNLMRCVRFRSPTHNGGFMNLS
jgi:hypothetical protein